MVYNSTFYFEFPPCCKDKTQLTKHSVFLTGVASAAILVVGLTIYICNMYICTYLPLLYFSYTIFVVVLLLDGQCGAAVGAATIYPFVCIDSRAATSFYTFVCLVALLPDGQPRGN